MNLFQFGRVQWALVISMSRAASCSLVSDVASKGPFGKVVYFLFLQYERMLCQMEDGRPLTNVPLKCTRHKLVCPGGSSCISRLRTVAATYLLAEYSLQSRIPLRQ